MYCIVLCIILCVWFLLLSQSIDFELDNYLLDYPIIIIIILLNNFYMYTKHVDIGELPGEKSPSTRVVKLLVKN